MKIPHTRGYFGDIYIFYSDSPCLPRFHPIKRLVERIASAYGGAKLAFVVCGFLVASYCLCIQQKSMDKYRKFNVLSGKKKEIRKILKFLGQFHASPCCGNFWFRGIGSRVV